MIKNFAYLHLYLFIVKNSHHLVIVLQIRNLKDEGEYAATLRELLDDHRDVITLLAEGFSECRKHIKVGIYP